MIVPSLVVMAATTDMDATSFKSTANPPQSIAGKAELATWSYGSLAVITPAAPDFPATSGYYTTTSAGIKSTLNLFGNNTKISCSLAICTSGCI